MISREWCAVVLAAVVLSCGSGNTVPKPADVSDDTATSADTGGACTTDEQCDDNSPCTMDLCLAGGECKHVPQAGQSCDDGSGCTENDVCQSDGTCAGTSMECPAKGPCQWSECDPEQGCVAHQLADGDACDDDDPCTTGESCLDGACVSEDVVVCPDINTNDCFVPTCNQNTGQCDQMEPAEQGAPCLDGNPCTENDVCNANGKCVGGDPVECPNGPCWTAWCNELTKEGNDPCTGDWKEEGVGCNDNDVCTSEDTCSWTGDEMVCKGKPVVCDDDNPCTVESCQPGVGCQYETLADGAVCADGDGPCFTEGQCQDGQCLGGGSKCYDENPCTDNKCDAETGECFFVPNTAPCDDGNTCTTGDACAGGECWGGASPCVGLCNTGECVVSEGGGYECQLSEDGTACDDGDNGTTWDVCLAGVCSGYCGEGPTIGAPCSVDQDDCEDKCGTQTLCDGTLKCMDGTCQIAPGTALVCAPTTKQCVEAVCDPGTDLCVEVAAFDGELCDDGYACTVDEACVEGACLSTVDLCADDHAVVVLSPQQQEVVQLIGQCDMIHLPMVPGEDAPAIESGDIVISQSETNPVFCRVLSVSDGPDGSLELEGTVAALEEAIPYGEFGYEGPASPELPSPGVGGDVDFVLGKEVYMPLPKLTIDSQLLPIGLKIEEGHVTVWPWLTVKGETDWWLLKWLMLELMGDISFDFKVTFILKGPVSGDIVELEEQVWPPVGTPKPTLYFWLGPVPCSASIALVGKFKFHLDVGVEPSVHVTGTRQFKAGLFWNPFDGVEPYAWSEGLGTEFEYGGMTVGASGGVEISLKPKVQILVGTMLGPTLTIGPAVKGEATFDAVAKVLEWLVQLCLQADIGGKLELFGKALFEVKLELLDKCLPGEPQTWCFDECLAGSSYCLNSSVRVDCKIDGDLDNCLDLVEADCPPGTMCKSGDCVASCVASTCQQLGKQCGENWDDGCGGTLDCGTCSGTDECTPQGQCKATCGGVSCSNPCESCNPNTASCEADYSKNNTSCDVGKYCSNGSCVACPGTWCQNNNHGWGSYCSGDTKHDCWTTGAGCYDGSSTVCDYGCSNGSCIGDPCSGVDCGSICKKCDSNSGQCVTNYAANGESCGSGKVCDDGACVSDCIDLDGDGYYSNCQPLDCSGHDDDPYIYPGAKEVWDMRDNDCDGKRDEDGLVKFTRYRKIHTDTDWEHRWSKGFIAGWEDEPWHQIYLYPTDVCTNPTYKPKDGCTPLSGGREIQLWGDFRLLGLAECSGVFDSGNHLTVYLTQHLPVSEYDDYEALAGFTCKRIGYVWNLTWPKVYPELVMVYRHRSSFDPPGKADNMWSTLPNEGENDNYNVHNDGWGVAKAATF